LRLGKGWDRTFDSSGVPIIVDEQRERELGRIALWLDPDDLEWLATRADWCSCTDDTPQEERERCGRIRFRASAAAHKSGLFNKPIRGEVDDLRSAVLALWDPIGVAGEPAAADEYDSYLSSICRELRDGTPESLAALLHGIATEQMGLSRPASADQKAAEALFALWREAPET
jgi:hypothetical protein